MGEAESLDLCNCNISGLLNDIGPTLKVSRDHLRVLDLSRNPGITGTLDVLALCGSLETLNLYQLREISGGLQPLRFLVNMTEINISYCRKLSGDLEPLGNLKNLRALNASTPR